MTDGSLRVAFIGTGKMARLHLAALRRIATPHQVVAACDVSEASVREFAALASGVRAYTALEPMLHETNPHIVHVVTPAGRHFEPARASLRAGASVYVEKPFVESTAEASALLALAEEHGLVVCAGHQLIREEVFTRLAERAGRLGTVRMVDSDFQFFPPALRMHRAGPAAKAAQLLDILPHPLYALVELLERFRTGSQSVRVEWMDASPTEVSASLRAGSLVGRLFVSLEARPVASTLTVRGSAGSATADLMRQTLLGPPNAGTGPLEKMLNPLIEGLNAQLRTTRSVGRRILSGGDYPGLTELLGDFYSAVDGKAPPPLSRHHLESVTSAYEQIARAVRESVDGPPRSNERRDEAPLAVVTGARGFLGRELTRTLANRGFRVRGVSRGADPDNAYVDEWCAVDLGRAAPAELFANAAVVVHAAAETAGGFEAHERNSVLAARNVLAGMRDVGGGRLIHVSSISTVRAPKSPWERQDESTPMLSDARRFGPYAWGKTESEALIQREAPGQGVAVRIVRPGALIDWRQPELPGIVGRRLFGDWHLGIGRPGMPVGVVDVEDAAEVIAWMAECYEEAPTLLNLNDERLPTRGALVAAYRELGWRGRMLWVPVSALSLAFHGVRWATALLQGRRPERLAVWGVLRPRRYDMTLSAEARRRATAGAPIDRFIGEPVRAPARAGASSTP